MRFQKRERYGAMAFLLALLTMGCRQNAEPTATSVPQQNQAQTQERAQKEQAAEKELGAKARARMERLRPGGQAPGAP